MCTSAFIDGQMFERVCDLAARIGAVNIVFLDGYPPFDNVTADDSCLCPVDIEASAAKAGLSGPHDHDGDPMEYYFTTQDPNGLSGVAALPSANNVAMNTDVLHASEDRHGVEKWTSLNRADEFSA